MEGSIEVLTGLRGQTNLCLGGYIYSKHVENVNTIRWRCARRKSFKCSGAVTTSREIPFSNPTNFKGHSHPPNEQTKEVTKVRTKLRETSMESNVRPIQALATTLRETPDEVKKQLCNKVSTIQRDIRRQRQLVLPPVPKSVSDLEIPAEWTVTGGEDSKAFLLHDSGHNNERFIMFGTVDSVDVLGRSKVWYMDGTFKTSSNLFQQLYVVRGCENDVVTSCTYVFMTNKTEEMYSAVFKVLLNKIIDRGYLARPNLVMMDFEKGAMNAISKILGNDMRVKGCYFHLCQNTWKHIQQYGLTTLYKNREDIKLFCGMMDALAFLPEQDVPQGMLFLWATSPVELVDLLLYFEQTYIGGKVGTDNVAMSFPPHLWNLHDLVLENSQKTNNFCEAWNNRFKQLVGQANPSFWTVLGALQKDEALERTKRLLPPESKTNKKEKVTRDIIKNKCVEFDRKTISIEAFLRSVGSCIRFK